MGIFGETLPYGGLLQNSLKHRLTAELYINTVSVLGVAPALGLPP